VRRKPKHRFRPAPAQTPMPPPIPSCYKGQWGRVCCLTALGDLDLAVWCRELLAIKAGAAAEVPGSSSDRGAVREASAVRAVQVPALEGVAAVAEMLEGAADDWGVKL